MHYLPTGINTDNLHEILDKDINLEELDSAMKQLKLGKAVSEDTIANEFLKSPCPVTRAPICHLFKGCLRVGAYPWNTPLVTPLQHSATKLIKFRKYHITDTSNQLDLCHEARTSDHTLTLTTCTN